MPLLLPTQRRGPVTGPDGCEGDEGEVDGVPVVADGRTLPGVERGAAQDRGQGPCELGSGGGAGSDLNQPPPFHWPGLRFSQTRHFQGGASSGKPRGAGQRLGEGPTSSGRGVGMGV